MKFTLSWLKQHLDTDAPLATITDMLTALGLEVEGVEDRGRELAAFRIARVVSAEQHPNADKLRLCMVDTGSGDPVQVVCGAPNARAGIKVVFASPGAVIPATGDTLKVGAIRGVESRGMMCSERELKLSDEHNGIIELPDDAPVGGGFAEYRGLADPVIEIALTPDRADCAGVRGIARDLAAAGLGTLKPVEDRPVPAVADDVARVHLEAGDACPIFASRVVRGVRNGDSPQWLKDRLLAVGLRPISALVDITNLLSLDAARPLHVFDAGKVNGDLVVRASRAGEVLKALNGKDYTLPAGCTVIADNSGVLSLGGIMGGETTGCTAETTDVIIESALFDPGRTAATGRALQIDSDARYRFERGVDPESVLTGIERATRLVLELCGGEPGAVFVAGRVPDWRRTLTLRPSRVEHLGGVAVPEAEQERILKALGFELGRAGDGAGGVLTAVPPSWRADVQGEADLVEEVLRVHGFDKIPATPLPRPAGIPKPALDARQRRVPTARRALAGRGLLEAVTWSFMAGPLAALFGQADPALKLLNPISADLDVMRPSILPNLVQAAGRNAARGYPDAALFEVGPAYRSAEEGGQELVAAGLRAGKAVPRHWTGGERPVDALDAKADALALLETLGVAVANLQVSTDAPDWYHPGRSGCLRLGPTVLARFGELHPAVLEQLDVAGPAAAFEVFLDTVPQPRRKGTAKPLVDLSPFQPLTRDFAFVVDAGVEADRLVRAARGADKALIARVDLFDLYQGPGVGEGRKSLALSVTLQPRERTLTEAEIDEVAARIVAAVAKATGATLRG